MLVRVCQLFHVVSNGIRAGEANPRFFLKHFCFRNCSTLLLKRGGGAAGKAGSSLVYTGEVEEKPRPSRPSSGETKLLCCPGRWRRQVTVAGIRLHRPPHRQFLIQRCSHCFMALVLLGDRSMVTQPHLNTRYSHLPRSCDSNTQLPETETKRSEL